MGQSKSVFITGTSAGFGYATAKALAERGHTVYATMRGTEGKNAHKAEELRTFAAKTRYNLRVLELDVTKDESVQRAVEQAIDAEGVNVVIHNAGVGTYGVQESFTIDQIKAVFDVNVFGVLRLNRALLPHFRQNGEGRVVFISSGLGRLVFPFMGPYTASKFAIEALGQTASYELAPLGIESIIVEPGAFGTTFSENSVRASDSRVMGQYGPVVAMMDSFVKGFEDRAKAGQLGDPQELVRALVNVVEAPKGKLPTRMTVGADVLEPVTEINQISDQVQQRLLKRFGM